MSKQKGLSSAEWEAQWQARWDARLDIVSVERIVLDGNEVNTVMLSDGGRALLKKDILPLLEREKRHTRAMLRNRYPEYRIDQYGWGVIVKDTKFFFHKIGEFCPEECVYPLSAVIDLFRYHTKFRDTKSANLLKDLEEYADRPHTPNVLVVYQENFAV